ncbi:MAG: ATP-binding cassette domain-containing protein [Flavobacteriales bacterium]|nr:ATP-binding cassette domain-containing protein [Flavobacteriales bacterium]
MGEVLIKAEGVSKKFAKNLKKSLAYGFSDLVHGILGKNTKQDLRKDEFWAVKDVSFEVRRGECLGLIGHNGAGKSTLLKMLNGIIAPDEGTITMHGKIGALIELGAGFNPILTGRENIYNNGAVIGFSKEEINAKLQEIISFAELEEFIDMPVQNYSSGMRVRLGFAIAAQMEPDILLIDEVLAVGDVGFRGKCYQRISELMSKTAFIFVSHSMPQISKICTSSVLLSNGKIKLSGVNAKVIEAYYNDNKFVNVVNYIINEKIELLELKTEKQTYSDLIKKLQVIIKLKSNINIKDAVLNIFLISKEMVPVAQYNSKLNGDFFDFNLGENTLVIDLINIFLNTGFYTFSITLEHNEQKVLLWVQNLNEIKIINELSLDSPVMLKGSKLC